MRDAVATSAMRGAPSLARYPIARLFDSGAQLLLQPVLTLPILVWLLGGSPAQIAWYVIVAGIGAGLASASGALVAKMPASTRVVLAALLAVQAVGFLVAMTAGLGSAGLGDATMLRLSAAAYLLITIPAAMLARISEQGYEFRQASSATVVGIMPAVLGAAMAGMIVWRLFFVDSLGPDDILGRVILGGAVFATAGSWLATWPTVLSEQQPHPARPLPSIRWPEFRANRALRRYSLFQATHGLAHFADPFLFVGVVTLIAPDIAWLGGAAIAWAAGETIARLIAIKAYGSFNVRVIFTISGTLHAIGFIVIAFAADVLGTSLVAERTTDGSWRNWAVIAAALALGAGHRLARTGHHAYVRLISSPGTRDLSLTIIGIVMVVVAFAPLIAVRLLDSQDLATLLQIGAGASIIGLLATALVVPTYATPNRPRGAWGLRRQAG